MALVRRAIFFKLKERWNFEKKTFLHIIQGNLFSLYQQPNEGTWELFMRRDIRRFFEENLKAIDLSLEELRRTIQRSLTGGDWSSFYEHIHMWQTENRLWMILGNRIERQDAYNRIMLSRNPPPTPSPEPESPDPPSRSPSPDRSPSIPATLGYSEPPEERERAESGLTSIASFQTLPSPPSP